MIRTAGHRAHHHCVREKYILVGSMRPDAKAVKGASAAAKAGVGAAKAGAGAAGKVIGGKALLYSGSALAFAGRRALWPGFVIGGAFSSAFWFGIYDATLSFSRLLMPVPDKPDRSAKNMGYSTTPVIMAGAGFAGWMTSPPMAAPPTSVVDLSGLFRYATSLPLRHIGTIGASSAVVAAITCRAVQYRGGA